jgi:hypothetical protein
MYILNGPWSSYKLTTFGKVLNSYILCSSLAFSWRNVFTVGETGTYKRGSSYDGAASHHSRSFHDSNVLFSKSKLCYDRPSIGLSVWCQAPIWGPIPDFCSFKTVAGLLMWGVLSYNCCWFSPVQSFSGPRPSGLITIFNVSDSRLSQTGGPGPRIYIPQEQGGPLIYPGTGFPFRRLLRLAGTRWRYSNPPPREDLMFCFILEDAFYTLTVLKAPNEA